MSQKVVISVFVYLVAMFWIALPAQIYAAPLWDNQKSGGDDYMVGTIHVGDDTLTQLPQTLLEVMNRVDVLVVETDLSSVSVAKQQSFMLDIGMLPPGQNVQSLLQPSTVSAVDEYLRQYNTSMAAFSRFKPWLIALTLVQFSYSSQGFDTAYGVDVQLIELAKQKGIKIVELETFEYQLNLFNQLFERSDVLAPDDMLLDTLNELTNMGDLPKQLIQAWHTADIKTLEKIYQQTLNSSHFDRVAEDVLLTQRNLNWSQQLPTLINNNKTLVAVGALHFVGPSSLIKLISPQFSLVSP